MAVLKPNLAVLAFVIVAAHSSSAHSQTQSPGPEASPWNGFYLGATLGYAWGTNDWTVRDSGSPLPVASGSFGIFQPFDAFTEAGSYIGGIHAGYNFSLGSPFVAGIEVGVSYPAFPDQAGRTIGGQSTFVTSAGGVQTFSEDMVHGGTLLARLGYTSGSWLVYATGGLAFTHDTFFISSAATGISEDTSRTRYGWAAGAGIEVPLIPQWTAKLEYLLTQYPRTTVSFPTFGQVVASELSQQQLRLGLNYQFQAPAAEKGTPSGIFSSDRFAVHGQMTFVEQLYPAFRSPYAGPNSLPGGGLGRETWDATLYVGFRPWGGGELWFSPELDQGFGVGNTHGAAGFPSGESYKLGATYPYTRLQRAFFRQTIDLGGEAEKVEADLSQFEGTQTANRLVFTVGRFAITDIFDTNKYANNPKTDFFNWTLINAGTFDYAGDGWGLTYGVAVEWYHGRWTLRGGLFDLSATPAGGDSPSGSGLDSTFRQFSPVLEIEERHKLFGEPGKIKLTAFLNHGRAGRFADAVALAQATGSPADINAVRGGYTNLPGISLNSEQQLWDGVGLFARVGWADGRIEPWDFTDVDLTFATGLSISGKPWGRPDDTIGIGAVINSIADVHEAFLNLGGLGILVGDGKLPHPDAEKILETYYSYALTTATKLSVDYQLIANPAYNSDRGPVSLFGVRVHTQF
jgi:high affinity Mn2+ porin